MGDQGRWAAPERTRPHSSAPRYLPAISPLSPRYLPAISPISPNPPGISWTDSTAFLGSSDAQMRTWLGLGLGLGVRG